MRNWVKLAIAVAIVALGVGIAVTLVATKPKAANKEREKIVPAVKVVTAQAGEYTVKVATQGEVMPRRETLLAAQVSGRVYRVPDKFQVGERFAGGEILLEIDPADYEAAEAKAASDLADARLALEQEEALAERAKRDWEELGGGEEPSELVLRKPQLASADARVKAAESGLEKAKRDVERATVRAPYPCQIRSTRAELGASVGVGSPLAEVFSVGDFELRLPVSLEDFAFVKAEAGVPVEFHAEFGGERVEWSGELLRTEGQVDRGSRSMFLVARVSPGDEGTSARRFLAPGLFLKAEVVGETLQGVFRIPRVALMGKDKILIVRPDDTVALRVVKVVRTERDEVVIDGGLEAGERVAVSPVPNVIDGMKVSVIEQKDAGEGEVPPVGEAG